MENRQRSIIIAISTLLVFGGLLEFMKLSKNNDSMLGLRKTGFFGVSLSTLNDDDADNLHHDSSNQSLAAERARHRLSGRIHIKNSRLGGVAPTSVRDSAKENTSEKSKDASGKLGDPKKVNIADTKAKAKDAAKAKKKKKKKKAEAKKNEAQVSVSVTEKNPSNSHHTDSANDFGSGIMYPTVASQSQSPVHQNNESEHVSEHVEDFQSFEEWTAYIMPAPSYERTTKMIHALLTMRLDTSIFHRVVAEMLADSREKMQGLGLTALGAYPSFKSYLMLYSANIKFPSSSPLKIQSRNLIKSYSKVENLRYLSSVLSADVDNNAIFEAVRLIHSAATLYAGSQNQSNSSDVPPSGSSDAQTPAPHSTPTNIIRWFSPLIPVLNRLAQTSNDMSLRSEASSTLTQVKNLTEAS